MIMMQFRRFVTERFGATAWDETLKIAGLPSRAYAAVETYPDEELVRLVAAARQVSKTPSDVLLESFGEALVPGLVQIYGSHLRPEWTTLDVILHTEATIHSVVRQQNPGATPPPLRASRRSEREVQVSYASPRRLCAVARGICRGLARHFGETIQIEEPSCMLRGGRTCEIVVRRVEFRGGHA
jgi:hypothetical protein